MQNKILKLSSKAVQLNLVNNFDASMPKNKTLVYVKHNSHSIYFDFIVYDKCIIPFGKLYNEPLFKGDIVEVLLTLDCKNYYLEIEVNPNGIQYAVLIKNTDGKGDIIITAIDKSPFESVTQITENGWKCNICIKKSTLLKLGWNEDNCFINIHRQDYKRNNELKLYSLSPTKCSTFHMPDAFVKLQID